jgi:hypothetical protein
MRHSKTHEHNEHMAMGKKVLLGTVAAAVGFAVVVNLPDFRRYLKISTM